MRDWPLYKVATQLKEGDNVVIRDVRCPDLEELRKLVRRLLNISNLNSLAFFEVHQTKDNVTTIVIESSKAWPKKVPTENHKVIYAPKVPTAYSQEEGVVPESRPTKALVALGPEPRPISKVIIDSFSKPKKVVKVDEISRPLRIHTREVA